jgi:hypothetical protein
LRVRSSTGAGQGTVGQVISQQKPQTNIGGGHTADETMLHAQTAKISQLTSP